MRLREGARRVDIRTPVELKHDRLRQRRAERLDTIITPVVSILEGIRRNDPRVLSQRESTVDGQLRVGDETFRGENYSSSSLILDNTESDKDYKDRDITGSYSRLGGSPDEGTDWRRIVGIS